MREAMVEIQALRATLYCPVISDYPALNLGCSAMHWIHQITM